LAQTKYICLVESIFVADTHNDLPFIFISAGTQAVPGGSATVGFVLPPLQFPHPGCPGAPPPLPWDRAPGYPAAGRRGCRRSGSRRAGSASRTDRYDTARRPGAAPWWHTSWASPQRLRDRTGAYGKQGAGGGDNVPGSLFW